MAILPIVKYGDPVLHSPALPVRELTPAIHRLIEDMIETMYAAPGIGLAAPQVGQALRIITIDLSVGRDPGSLIVMVNPECAERDGTQTEEEGCLSVPTFNATVARPARVLVRGLDRAGQERAVEGRGLLARAFQHEIDHIDGLLFLDRLRGIKRDLIVRRIKKLARTGKWG